MVHAVMFSSQQCPACQETKRSVLPPIEARFGDKLELRQLDLADREAFVALMTVAARLGIPPKDQKIPFLVIGERALIGLGPIRGELPGLVEASPPAASRGRPRSRRPRRARRARVRQRRRSICCGSTRPAAPTAAWATWRSGSCATPTPSSSSRS